jgi:hypothetical protein
MQVRRAGRALVAQRPVDWAADVASVAGGARPAAAGAVAVSDAAARDAAGVAARCPVAAEVWGVAAAADGASSNSAAHTRAAPHSSAPSNPQY